MGDQVETRPRADSAEVAFRKIFIGGLSYSTDEEKLKKYFKQYGNVQDAVVMKDPVSKRSRGFGFITFVDVASVDNALANEPHTIDSRKVEAKRAVPRSEISRDAVTASNQKSASSQKPNAPATSKPAAASAPTSTAPPAPQQQQQDSNKHISNEARGNLEDYAYNKIFVGGLHYDTRDAEFRAYFEKYGRVISAEVMFNRETHKSRGFGFIVFEVENSAVKVCNVKEHSIDGKVVEVKRAIPRSRLPAGTPTASINAGTYKMPTPVHSAPPTTAAPAPAAKTVGITAGAPSANAASNSKPAAAGAGAGRKAYSAVAGGNNSDNSGTYAGAVSAPPATGSPATSRTVSSTSYAAALKGATTHDSASGSILGSASTVPLRDHAAPHIGNSGMNLLLSVQRPNRSYSEPIVKFEGSSALNGDSIPLDSALLNRNSNAGTISNASSRSNSIVQAPSGSLVIGNNVSYSPDSSHGKSPVTLGNLPWLASPPSNPLDPTGGEFGLPLPPATEQHKHSGGHSNDSHHSGNRSLSSTSTFSGSTNQGMHGSNGMWFPTPQMGLGDAQQQAAFQQAAMHQQQYMGGAFGGMMFPYMNMPPPPPGVAPSPDVWAAMVSNHAMMEQQHHHQQNVGHMQMPPGQFPGQFMMPAPFPFYAPDGSVSFGPGPGATPQQQMMFYNAQQAQMQAQYNHMQQLQYQNQAQAMALAQAQAQVQAMGNSNPSAAGANGSLTADQKALGSGFNGAGLGYAGGMQNAGVPAGSAGKTSEQTESDDLFHFAELTMDSKIFEPTSAQPWAPAARR